MTLWRRFLLWLEALSNCDLGLGEYENQHKNDWREWKIREREDAD
jgi:hypothetical protein